MSITGGYLLRMPLKEKINEFTKKEGTKMNKTDKKGLNFEEEKWMKVIFTTALLTSMTLALAYFFFSSVLSFSITNTNRIGRLGRMAKISVKRQCQTIEAKTFHNLCPPPPFFHWKFI